MSQLKITKFEDGSFGGSNTFLIYDEKTKKGFVFDPGFRNPKLFEYIDDKGLDIDKIFLTHGHYDHIGGVEELKEKTGAKVYISEKEKDYLGDPRLNLSAYTGDEVMNLEPADILVKDGDVIELEDGLTLSVMETPGHTPGSVSYVLKNCIVVGDLLFKGSIGRTDFEGGNDEEMKTSLKKIVNYPDDTIILPGHKEVTTVGRERLFNPFLRALN